MAFTGRHVVIPSGSTDIGRATAQGLAVDGRVLGTLVVEA